MTAINDYIKDWYCVDVRAWPKEYYGTPGPHQFQSEGKTLSLHGSAMMPKIIPTAWFKGNEFILEVECTNWEPDVMYIHYGMLFKPILKVLDDNDIYKVKPRTLFVFSNNFQIHFNNKAERDYAHNVLAIMSDNVKLIKLDGPELLNYLECPFAKYKRNKERDL